MVGTGGPGSVHHLSLELIKRSFGADIGDVPYKGIAPAVAALLANDVGGVITGPETVIEHIRAGKLRALAVGADQRVPVLPDVPTLNELLAPSDLLLTTHFTLHAPGKTPRATVEQINAAVRKALADADLNKRFQARGLVISASSAQEVDDGIAKDGERLGKLIREAGIKLD